MPSDYPERGRFRSPVPVTIRRTLLGGAAMNRRDWFQFSSLALGSQFAVAQEKPAEALVPLNRFPRTVQEFYVAKVREVEKACLDVQSKLKTKADAENYLRGVK